MTSNPSVFVIAEAGVNHNRPIDMARKLLMQLLMRLNFNSLKQIETQVHYKPIWKLIHALPVY
jgi:sialic acid synthase SpsE